MYVTNRGDDVHDGTVSVINPSNTVVGSPITVGVYPRGIALCP
jgi:YVTN family beta-propeller protein